MSTYFVYVFLGYLCTLVFVVGYYPHLYSKSYSHWRALPQFLVLLGLIFGIFYYCFPKTIEDPDNIYGATIIGLILWIIVLIVRSTYLYYVVGYGKRYPGHRKKPYSFKHLIGGGTVILGIIVWYGYYYEGLKPSYLGRLVVLLMGLSFFFDFENKFDLSYQDEEERLTKLDDAKGTALFIRSFKTEKAPFWTGWVFNSPVDTSSLNTALMMYFPFYQYFGEAFKDHFGPLVGLGSPRDTFPTEGMVISYENDKDWKVALLHHLEACKSIIMVKGQSNNLSWELDQIKSQNKQNKFFIFTPPHQSSFWYNVHLLFLGLKKEIPSWAAFAEQMESMGYPIPPQKPASGSIIAFDKNCQGYLLKDDLSKPEDYVLAIKGHLKKG